MRPVRIITAVIFATAVAVTGCAAHSTTVDPTITPTARWLTQGPDRPDQPGQPP